VVPGPTGALLAQVVQHIAHYPIRQRGTFAGSLAHADPASEWCVVARLLEAEIVARSPRGERRLKAAEYFHGTFATALTADEVITEVRLPILDASWRTGFNEFSRRAGDFAIAMSAVALKTSGSKIVEARIAIGGVEDRPSRCAQAEAVLMRGGSPADAASAVAAAVKPMEDLHADAAYRKDLVRALARRALEQALAA
jgi:carbon-monoxide dehydrogenase medium subunit